MKRVKIYGERNSGTNLINSLVASQAHVKSLSGTIEGPKLFRKFIQKHTRLTDLYFAARYARTLGWKHGAFPALNYATKHDVNFICMIKHPLSWLVSLYRKPYSVHADRNVSFSTFIRSTFPTSSRDNIRRDGSLTPIDLWNYKTATYARSHYVGGVVLHFEDIFNEPDYIYNTLILKDIIKPNHTGFTTSPLKPDGRQNYDKARDFYQNNSWKSFYSGDDVDYVRSKINDDLIEYLRYKI